MSGYTLDDSVSVDFAVSIDGRKREFKGILSLEGLSDEQVQQLVVAGLIIKYQDAHRRNKTYPEVGEDGNVELDAADIMAKQRRGVVGPDRALATLVKAGFTAEQIAAKIAEMQAAGVGPATSEQEAARQS